MSHKQNDEIIDALGDTIDEYWMGQRDEDYEAQQKEMEERALWEEHDRKVAEAYRNALRVLTTRQFNDK